MSFFKKTKILNEEDMQPNATENHAMHYSSYISYGCRYTGNLEGDSNVKIDGEIIGDIILKGNLKIGDKGKVVGNISITSGEVFGCVDGHIKCDETLVLRKGSIVKGNITSGNILVESDTVLEGIVKVHVSDGLKKQDDLLQ